MEIFSNNCMGALKRIKTEKPAFKLIFPIVIT